MIENPNVICNDCGFCKQNKKLKKQLEITVNALKRIMEGYKINGPCEEDCVGYYMFWDAKRAMQDCDTLKEVD